MTTSLYDIPLKTLAGQPFNLADLKGQVLLVVNVASRCGLTPQYEGLEKLHEKFGARGLAVLGFPCNDFLGQEPGSADEIQSFCTTNYGVRFPMFEKQKVKGPDKSPLYKTLTEDLPEGLRGEVKWNFTKFLVDPSGRVVARFASDVDPLDASVTTAIEAVLPPKRE